MLGDDDDMPIQRDSIFYSGMANRRQNTLGLATHLFELTDFFGETVCNFPVLMGHADLSLDLRVAMAHRNFATTLRRWADELDQSATNFEKLGGG